MIQYRMVRTVPVPVISYFFDGDVFIFWNKIKNDKRRKKHQITYFPLQFKYGMETINQM